MPDRRRRNSTPKANSLVAAAQIMVSPNPEVRRSSVGSGKALGWQHDAWDYYDNIGELRFGVSWIANAMSRVNLGAAMPPEAGGSEPVLLDPEDPTLTPTQRRAIEIIGMIADGEAGQGLLLQSFGIHLSVAGIGWMVVEPDLNDPLADQFSNWQVLATEELREASGIIEIRVDERLWRPLHPRALVVKVWRKHPRYSWTPDAPTRGVLGVLREIDLLTKHIQASAQSRLAGAGLLAIPSEAVFPPGQGPQSSQTLDPDDEDITPPEDNFIDTLIETMTVPLTDRGSAAAVVPLVIRVPGDLVDKIKHLSFATPFDDRVQSLLDNAIKRLALGMDIPPEILTGTGAMNHWGAWQVAEEAITLHIEPLSETIVHALTIAYLRPALLAEGLNPDEVMVWYDTADLRTRPDKSKSAIEAYDRNQLSAIAMLREMGLSPDDMPTDEEKRENILLGVVRGAPTLAPAILTELGYLSPAAIESAPEPGGESQAMPEPSAPEEPQGPPTTQPEAGDAIEASALVAACDVVVHRALERAGSRLRSAAGKKTTGGAAAIECDNPATLHTMIDATTYADLGSLLDGAWTLVPAIAQRCAVDPDALVTTLDIYARALLAAGHEHEYDRLADALGLSR